MKKLIGYIKPYTVAILCCIVFLSIQAGADLALPDYMAKIVNVGIQQNGIEKVYFETIAKDEMEKISLLLDEKDKNYLKEQYDFKDGRYTVKSNINKEELEKITKEGIKFNLGTKMIKENIKANISEEEFYKKISFMKKDDIDSLKVDITEKFNKIDETIREQIFINTIKEEYKTLGIDMEAFQTKYIIKIGIQMLVIALIGMAGAVVVGFLGSKVGTGVGHNLRSGVFKKVLSFSNDEFNKVSKASLITRTTNDIQGIQVFVMMLLKMMFYAPILAMGGIFKVFETNKDMAWIVVMGIAGILIIAGIVVKFALPKTEILQNLLDKLNLKIRERLNGILVIRAFNTEKDEEKKFTLINNDFTKENIFVNRIMALTMPGIMLIMNVLTILIVWFGGKSIDSNVMQVGDMMAFIQYSMQIMVGFIMMSMLIVFLPRAIVSAKRIEEVLNMESSIVNKKDSEKIEEITEIEFKNVSFSYDSAEEKILKDISFKVKKGEVLAIVGGTGSGKSTIVNLIPRLIDSTDGEILISEKNIRDIDTSSLRQKIGFVPQKGILFSGSIEENIKLNEGLKNKEEILKVLENSESKDFVYEKQGDISYKIAQGGKDVSGGQRQRLAIARALLKDADFYIFDDSFSALDLKTDKKVRKNIKENYANKGIIIVAQRISTVLDADKIIVIEDGYIKGMGKHKDLMENCSVYREIVMSQLSREEALNEK